MSSPTPEEETQFHKQLHGARVKQSTSEPDGSRVKGKKVIWTPQPGSQTMFLKCPLREVLFHGSRGGGKTDALIMDFAQHVGQGFGPAWRGVIFRETYPQLGDVVAKSEKWFHQIFPSAKLNRAKMMWEWESGEALLMRHMKNPADYWNYHGHEYPWIGFEELTNWATDECYLAMFSCCRSSTPNVPRKIRATTNPYGAGHNWVKERFRLQGKWWTPIVIDDAVDRHGEPEHERVAIHSHVSENRILLKADPKYQRTVSASASNDAMREAWKSGSWDIVAGGMFDDVWNSEQNLLTPFEIPPTWKIDRSFDWGSSKPFSVGWWAESDGSDYVDHEGVTRPTVRGDLFRIGEWYGWTGQANQGLKMLAKDVAKGIVERQLLMFPERRVQPGPADSAIYTVENGQGIALDMARPVRIGDKVHPGVQWTRSDKRPGSRKTGWEAVRERMKNAHRANPGDVRESPGLFVFTTCTQFVRTVPTAPRCKKDPDDIPTEIEDHCADEVRYKVRSMSRTVPTAGGVGVGAIGPKLVEGPE